MIQGLGNLLGTPGYNQAGLGTGLNQTGLGGLNNLATGLNALNTLGLLGNNQAGLLGNNQGGLLGGLAGLGGGASSNPLSGLLSAGLRCSQNEQRLMQEKEQRNLLKKYLIQQTGDPIQSSLISNTIPGRGALDDFDVGLGTRSSILQQLGLSNPNQSNLLGRTNNNLMGNLGTLGSLASLAGGNNNNSLAKLSTLGSLANLANKSNTSNPGLLSSLVSLASTPNNNGNILNSLGGLGTGLLGGGNAANSGGLMGSLQSGINTLNTINKVNNAVSSVQGLFA